LHAHCAYPDGVGVGLAARVLGLPYVITAHGSDINVYAQYSRLAWQIRWALGGAAAVIAVSRSLHAKITRLLGAAADRTPLHQIACAGFNPAVFFPGDRAEARRELGVLPQGRVVIFVGQLVTIKAVDRLVEAWRLLAADGRARPEDRLILVGEGPTRDALERQVADASLADRVTFAGAYPQATVARWLRGADVLCLPSHNEGTPNVIVEALASGVPVVASDVGGIPDMIEPGVSGLLVPPGDAPALAGALAAALARPWDRDRVRQTVASRTWDAIGAATVDVLAEVVNNTAGDRRAAVA
jgi:glycosyltransferase involved in cell wall biosynthesis